MHKPLGVPTLVEARDLCGSIKSGEDWSLPSGGFVAVAVLSLSPVRLFVTPRTAACQASLSFVISQSLLTLMSIESVTPSNQLILSHLLLLPSIFPSVRVFSNESALCIRWPEYWSFSFRMSPSNEYSGLISFRMDLFDFFAVLLRDKHMCMTLMGNRLTYSAHAARSRLAGQDYGAGLAGAPFPKKCWDDTKHVIRWRNLLPEHLRGDYGMAQG